MEVESIGRAVYLVHAHGETFHCDLLAYRKNGKCDCWAFLRAGGFNEQIEHAMAAGTFVPGPRTRCPHLAAARDDLLDLFLQQLLKQFPDDKQTT